MQYLYALAHGGDYIYIEQSQLSIRVVELDLIIAVNWGY